MSHALDRCQAGMLNDVPRPLADDSKTDSDAATDCD
jgi:hypothetical protein